MDPGPRMSGAGSAQKVAALQHCFFGLILCSFVFSLNLFSSPMQQGMHIAYVPAGLWILIHFLGIRIHIFFSMLIRILSQPYKICKKLPYKVRLKT